MRAAAVESLPATCKYTTAHFAVAYDSARESAYLGPGAQMSKSTFAADIFLVSRRFGYFLVNRFRPIFCFTLSVQTCMPGRQILLRTPLVLLFLLLVLGS